MDSVWIHYAFSLGSLCVAFHKLDTSVSVLVEHPSLKLDVSIGVESVASIFRKRISLEIWIADATDYPGTNMSPT